MSKQTIIQIGVVGVVVLAVAGISFLPKQSTAIANKDHIEVRWLIAHKPVDLFARAMKTFSEVLEQESGGTMSATILTGQDVGLPSDDVSAKDVFQLMNEHRIEMSSPLAAGIGEFDPAFRAVNLPYLFSNYTDAFAALDGSVGQTLLTNLPNTTPVRGLAFTLSGGFRVITSDTKNFVSPKDFKGMTIVTTAGAVGEATLRALGANPILNSAVTTSTKPDATEMTYTRASELPDAAYIKYVTETNHSIFLTAIVVRNDLYTSLSPQNRAALEKAALAAAKIEREDSIALAEKVRADLIAKGTKVVQPSAQQLDVLKSQTKSVYSSFTNPFVQ